MWPFLLFKNGDFNNEETKNSDINVKPRMRMSTVQGSMIINH